MKNHDWLPLIYDWVLLIWILQAATARLRISSRGGVRLAVTGALAGGVLALPIDGVPLARWALGFTANFSLPFLGLILASIWNRTCNHELLTVSERRAGWAFGLISGLALYPFALGLGRTDSYTWGWHFSILFAAAGVVTIFLLWKGNRFAYLLLGSIVAYWFRLLESTNYWDYLVDPVYCLVSLPALCLTLVPKDMSINFQRRVDAAVGPFICAVLSLLARFRRKPAAPPVRRVLVILLSEMGSLVLAHEMFTRLKQRYPGVSVHALVFARHREALDLMGVIPEENVLTLDERSLKNFLLGGLRMLFRLRALRFDVVIDCELFARVSSILAYLSGAPVLVGFHPHTQEGLYRGSFINRPVMYNPYRHLSQQLLTLVGAIESDSVPVCKSAASELPDSPPTLKYSPEELVGTANRLYADFPSLKGKPLVLLFPSGGILPIRAWPTENYVTIGKAFLEDGYAVGILGMPADKALGQSLVTQSQSAHCVDLTGYTHSIRHLLELFNLASLLITNDGGPGQLAALTPLPTIVLFGPETPLLYRPLGRNVQTLYVPLPCSPCLTAYNHRTSPCDGDNQCLKRITPEQVLAKAREMLSARPPITNSTSSSQSIPDDPRRAVFDAPHTETVLRP